MDHLFKFDNFIPRADKGQGNKIHPVVYAEIQVLFVLFGNRADGQIHAGEVHPFIRLEKAAVFYSADHIVSLHFINNHIHEAVIKKNPVSRLDIFGQRIIGYGNSFFCTFDFFWGKDYFFTGNQLNTVVFNFSGTYFWPLKVKEYSRINTHLGRYFPD